MLEHIACCIDLILLDFYPLLFFVRNWNDYHSYFSGSHSRLSYIKVARFCFPSCFWLFLLLFACWNILLAALTFFCWLFIRFCSLCPQLEMIITHISQDLIHGWVTSNHVILFSFLFLIISFIFLDVQSFFCCWRDFFLFCLLALYPLFLFAAVNDYRSCFAGFDSRLSYTKPTLSFPCFCFLLTLFECSNMLSAWWAFFVVGFLSAFFCSQL